MRFKAQCRCRATTLALATALAAALAAALWWRRNPSACPYSQRFWVQAPHPVITRARLRAVLEPCAGERVLEVGPGTGYYALPVAEWLGPEGRLDILDIQPEMLEHTLRRAVEAGLTNIHATTGDAQQLPFGNATFDRAYLVTVLGEIPDQDAALAELCRVLKPGGRLVVGEVMLDPHYVTRESLGRRATKADLERVKISGNLLGHFTALRRGVG